MPKAKAKPAFDWRKDGECTLASAELHSFGATAYVYVSGPRRPTYVVRVLWGRQDQLLRTLDVIRKGPKFGTKVDARHYNGVGSRIAWCAHGWLHKSILAARAIAEIGATLVSQHPDEIRRRVAYRRACEARDLAHAAQRDEDRRTGFDRGEMGDALDDAAPNLDDATRHAIMELLARAQGCGFAWGKAEAAEMIFDAAEAANETLCDPELAPNAAIRSAFDKMLAGVVAATAETDTIYDEVDKADLLAAMDTALAELAPNRSQAA